MGNRFTTHWYDENEDTPLINEFLIKYNARGNGQFSAEWQCDKLMWLLIAKASDNKTAIRIKAELEKEWVMRNIK